jgi:hypothetical protein
LLMLTDAAKDSPAEIPVIDLAEQVLARLDRI